MNDDGHPLADWRETRETFIVYAVLLSLVLAVILVGFGAWGGSMACKP
jgi:regulatory protein YycI of two-component signal transduction system YycFG